MRSEDYGDHSTRGGLVTEKWPTPRDVIWAFRVVGYLVRGARYVAMERYDQALADFDRAIELDPTEDEFAAERTEIRQLTGRSDTDDALPSNPGTKDT